MAGKRYEIPGIFKNALILFSGSSVAQLIALGLTPILSRIYSPDDFGVLALFLAISGFFGIVATFRYELAIMLPKDDAEAGAVAKLCILIALSVSVFSAILLGFFGDRLCVLLDNQAIGQWLWTVPVLVFITGIFQTLNYWKTRRSEFKQVAGARIIQSSINAGGQVALYTIKGGGLIIAYIIGMVSGAIHLIFKTSAIDRKNYSHASRDDMKQVAQKYNDFPRFNSVQALVDSLQSSGVVFFVSSFFGAVALGWYSFTFRILQAPLGLIGSSIAQAFYQKASENFNNGENVRDIFNTSLRSLLVFALPVFTLVVIFAPVLFEFVFGVKWREAGVYAQYLAPWLFMNFLVSPFSQLPIIVGQQKKMLLFSLVGNLLILLSIVAGEKIFSDIKIGFLVLSIGQFIYLSIILYWFFRLSGESRIRDSK